MAKMRQASPDQQPPMGSGGQPVLTPLGQGFATESPFAAPGPGTAGPATDPVHKQVGLPIDPTFGRSGESPRERQDVQQNQAGMGGPQNGGQATLRRPSAPTPMAGGATTSPMSFEPLPDTGMDSLVSPQSGPGLYGGSRGLQGGGLGVPLDPIPNEQSDPITMLIKLLQGGQ